MKETVRFPRPFPLRPSVSPSESPFLSSEEFSGNPAPQPTPVGRRSQDPRSSCPCPACHSLHRSSLPSVCPSSVCRLFVPSVAHPARLVAAHRHVRHPPPSALTNASESISTTHRPSPATTRSRSIRVDQPIFRVLRLVHFHPPPLEAQVRLILAFTFSETATHCICIAPRPVNSNLGGKRRI